MVTILNINNLYDICLNKMVIDENLIIIVFTKFKIIDTIKRKVNHENKNKIIGYNANSIATGYKPAGAVFLFLCIRRSG
jgi:hypothetical protein